MKRESAHELPTIFAPLWVNQVAIPGPSKHLAEHAKNWDCLRIGGPLFWMTLKGNSRTPARFLFFLPGEGGPYVETRPFAASDIMR